MLYMVIERFRDGDPLPVYRRFKDRGRLAPAEVRYVGSWVASDFTTCFQLMECEQASSLDQWMANWRDVVDFEVVPVVTSAEALEAVRPRL